MLNARREYEPKEKQWAKKNKDCEGRGGSNRRKLGYSRIYVYYYGYMYVCVCVAVSGYYDGLTRQQPGSSACCMEAASLSLFRRGSSPER
jgi:hypothetical protein